MAAWLELHCDGDNPFEPTCWSFKGNNVAEFKCHHSGYDILDRLVDLKRKARANGWEFRGKRLLCPACAKKEKA